MINLKKGLILAIKTGSLTLALSLLGPSVSAQAEESPLAEIASSYDSWEFWGIEFGEKPVLYYLHDIASLEKKEEFLIDNLKKLNRLDTSLKKSALWHDLKYYSENELIVHRSCDPGVWDYVEAFQLNFFFHRSFHTLQSQDRKFVDYSSLDQILHAFRKVLEVYIEKIHISIDRQLVPMQGNRTIFGFQDAGTMGVAVENYLSIVDRFVDEGLCEDCPSIDRDEHVKKYNQIVGGTVDQFFDELERVKDLSERHVFSLPERIREECFTTIISSIGGAEYSPKDLLKLGERELRRAEEMMFSIITSASGDHGESERSPDEKNNIINDYLKMLRDESLGFFSSSEEYLQEVDRLQKRAQRLLPQVTSFDSELPLVKDLNYETDQFVPFYSSSEGQIFLNSKAPENRYGLASTIAHEGIPGHHLEQQRSFRADRRSFNLGLRAEGWAFYMEEFVDEIGYYENAAQKLFYMDYIRVRALRLIIPYKFVFENWTTEQAEEFIDKHSAMEDYMRNSELSRYGDWRGQVLTYMVGKEEIVNMRKKAADELGDDFSVVAFHDFILEQEDISLRTLKTLQVDWIQAQRMKVGR